MRCDGIASLKEALAQAGLDSRESYVAPQAIAERFRHIPPASLTTKSQLSRPEHSNGSIGAMTWILLILLLMSMLVAGSFILGRKSRGAPVTPCYVEARAELLSI